MNRFSTEGDAKEFLASEIVREAVRQGRPLTDIEQKMLHFSESGWTLPNIGEVAETFEQQCDAKAYERKVAGLARSARQHLKNDGASAWSDAVKRLEAGDHYLLVMVGQTGSRKPKSVTWQTAVAVILLIVGMSIIRPLVLQRFLGRFPNNDDLTFFTWATLVVLAAAYLVIRIAVGRDRVQGWMDHASSWFAGSRRP